MPRRKYLNRPAELDGHRFDSMKERERYALLKLMVRGGEIEALEVHPKYRIVWPGKGPVCTNTADFRYVERQTGETVVEDVKSPVTRTNAAYRLKKKLMALCHGVDVVEIV